MKTIRKGEEIKRISDKDAEFRVKHQGFEYCPKNVWKTHDKHTNTTIPDQSESAPKKRKGAKLTRSERREQKNNEL